LDDADASAVQAIEVRVRVEGNEFFLAIGPLETVPEGLRVSVVAHPEDKEQRFERPDLRALDDGFQELLTPFPAQPGRTFDVAVYLKDGSIGSRSFKIVELGDDEPWGLPNESSAIYDTRFRVSDGTNGTSEETQTGQEAHYLTQSLRPVRNFRGTGTINQTFGSLTVHVALNKVERSVIAGIWSQSFKLGSGTWASAAPSIGAGTIISYREEFVGQERVTFPGLEGQVLRKDTITVVLNGTMETAAATHPVRGSIFWTRWSDPSTGQVRWLRQRPAGLDSDPDSEWSGPPTSSMLPAVGPWTLRGLAPSPQQQGDRFAVATWGGKIVAIEASPPFAHQALRQQVPAVAWLPDPSGELTYISASTPELPGLALAWAHRAEAGNFTFTLSRELSKIMSG
jgi:hypothetical protein